MDYAEQSAPRHAASGLARFSFLAAGTGVLLLGAVWLLVAWFGDDWTVAQLVFWLYVLAFSAVVVGAVQGVRAVRRAKRQQQPRLPGASAAALSLTLLVLLLPIVLWNFLFFVCDCVSP